MLSKTLILANTMILALTFSSAVYASSFLSNGWETTDWLSVGLTVPTPTRHCKEKDDQPPCYRVTQAPFILRAEAGRFRYKRLQWNLVSGSLGINWVGREHIRLGVGGFGAHWKLSNPEHEFGFLIQLLSIYMGSNSFGSTNTNLHFRFNQPRFFWEMGVDFSMIWITNPLGNEKTWGDGIEGFPLSIYLSLGI